VQYIICACKGDEDEEEEGKGEEGSEAPNVPSLGDYIMHCLSLFWKVLFAFVPPTGQTLSSLVYYFILYDNFYDMKFTLFLCKISNI